MRRTWVPLAVIVVLLCLFLVCIADASSGRDFYKILGKRLGCLFADALDSISLKMCTRMAPISGTGLKKSADTAAIKRAYRKLSMKYHPDKNKGNEEEAKKKFQDVAAAYEALGDQEKRRIYDQHGEEGLKQRGAGGGGGNPMDIFSHFFGGGGQRTSRSRAQIISFAH